ncbi:glycosyltransferase family 2 protein [Candidatus Pacearchaeota archaeon]|nr:glycosyltransferase family 2 protein [Candidatus Pacearchaeota archaeon]
MKASFIIPSYNSEEVIKELLESIFNQDYPKKDFEVLVIDGGSTDKTIEIAKKYSVRILDNPQKSEEPARILGMNKAGGDILIFVDTDNVLVGRDWIKKALKPFEDKEISFADTLYYSYRKKDKTGVKYQALIGGDDPIIMYLGLYSRWNYLKNGWTGCPHEDENKEGYLKCKFLNKNKIPPMGSNGFLVRKDLAREFIKDSFIHSDLIYDLINNGHNCFAKVKVGIIHNQPKFFPNKIRRMERRKEGIKIKYNYGINQKKIFLTGLYLMLIIPVLFDTLRGFVKKPDSAWFFHPIATFGEIFIYGWYFLMYKFSKNIKLS